MTMNTQTETEKAVYTLNDPRKMLEDAKESYIRMIQTVQLAQQCNLVSAKFAGVAVELLGDVFYTLKDRLQPQPNND